MCVILWLTKFSTFHQRSIHFLHSPILQYFGSFLSVNNATYGDDPILIIEVLSSSTEGFDRGHKFLSYQKIETMREYILISQDKRQIEQWILNEKGKWQFEAVVKEGGLPLVCLPFELNIDDIYLNIELTPLEIPPQ